MVISTKEASNRAKAKKRGIDEQRPRNGRRRNAKPFILEFRYSEALRAKRKYGDRWVRWGSYPSERAREDAMKSLRHKHDIFEFRARDEEE